MRTWIYLSQYVQNGYAFVSIHTEIVYFLNPGRTSSRGHTE